MNSRGYLKIVDFGLAKHIHSEPTWFVVVVVVLIVVVYFIIIDYCYYRTMCGTPDYLGKSLLL